MAHYKEVEKLRREHYPIVSVSLIAEDFQQKSFVHTTENLRMKDQQFEELTVKKDFGAGVRFEISKRGKRHQSMSVELGKSDIEMLIRFLQSVELRDYNGTFTPTELIDLTK